MQLIEPKETTHFVEVDGEGTILDMETGQYLRLNQTATLMWRALIQSSTLDEAVAELLPQVEADEATLREAALRFLRRVEAVGLGTAAPRR